MSKNGQNKSTKNVILWTLIGIASAAVIAFCIYCFAVILPAKREADRLALEEQRKQQELEQTMAPTATTAPTSEPTATPGITEQPTPTEPAVEPTAAPTATVAPTVEPTAVPEITVTPEPTATSTPTPEPTPTEIPHEHTWVKKETKATCVEDGLTWEECEECGGKQNIVVSEEALDHRKCSYHVVTEPTLTKEGKYETTCDACGAVVSSGAIAKLTPTPTPTSTPTPKATATPTPTKKPSATPTPIVIITPTPTPVPAEVVETGVGQLSDGSSAEYILYEDGLKVYIEENTTSIYYKGCDVIYHKLYRDNNTGDRLYEEYLVRYEEALGLGETLIYYMYHYWDAADSSNNISRFVNSDGSFNRYSEHVFRAEPGLSTSTVCTSIDYKTLECTYELEYIKFAVQYTKDVLYITPNEFIYFENNIIHLFDY